MEYVCLVATRTPRGIDVETNRRSLIPRAEKKFFFRKATPRSVFLFEILPIKTKFTSDFVIWGLVKIIIETMFPIAPIMPSTTLIGPLIQ